MLPLQLLQCSAPYCTVFAAACLLYHTESRQLGKGFLLSQSRVMQSNLHSIISFVSSLAALLFPCISTNLNPQPLVCSPQRRGLVPIRCAVAGLRRTPIPSSESEPAPVIIAAQHAVKHSDTVWFYSTALLSEPIAQAVAASYPAG